LIDSYQPHTGGRVIPIVVVSAAGAVPRSAAANGVRQFLAKPFDVEDVAESIREVLNSADQGGAVLLRSPLEAITPLGSVGVDVSPLPRAPAPV
jgi:DNA-binding NtrC family response regulator